MAEDRKFKFEDGKFVNRVSGEPIPDDEPVIIFRARDRHALAVLDFYRNLSDDEHHRRAITDRINEFYAFATANPDRMKEPGITRHIRLNDETALTPTASTQSRIEMLEGALEAILKVRVEGHENIWAGSNRCQDIARTALQEPGR